MGWSNPHETFIEIHGAYRRKNRATSLLSIVASFRGATFSRRQLQSTGTEKDDDFNSATGWGPPVISGFINHHNPY